jgi:hypothetical protein
MSYKISQVDNTRNELYNIQYITHSTSFVINELSIFNHLLHVLYIMGVYNDLSWIDTKVVIGTKL